jgi:BASS family bile acid:Na+ symporter
MMAGISLILCILLYALGWYVERNRRPIESAQSMGQKNTTLVIWIATLYAGPVVALAPTCYVVWQNLVLSYLSARIKPKDSSKAEPAPTEITKPE